MKKIYKYNFSDEYAKNVLIQNKFVNQFQKLLYYQIVILDNYQNDEFKKRIYDFQDYILRKLYLNNMNYINSNPIKFLKKSFIETFLFYYKEENKGKIKANYSIDYLNILINKFKQEIFVYISKVYGSKTKNEKNDVHSIYSNIMNKINEFIKDYNTHPNTQLKIDYENLSFLDSFIIACIISRNSELILSNSREVLSKIINKLYVIFDVKTLEFLCNYFIYNFNMVKVEDYRVIILVEMIAICSNIERKKGIFSGNNSYSPENKKMFRKMFILLLKLIYIKIIADKNSEKFNQIFTHLDIIFKRIHNTFNDNPTNGAFLYQSPLNEINEYIKNKIGFQLFYRESLNKNNEMNEMTHEGKKYEINTKEIIQKLLEKKYNEKKNKLIFNIEKSKTQHDTNNLLNIEEMSDTIFTEPNNEQLKKTYKIDHSLINNKSIEVFNKYQISTLSKLKLYKRIKYDLFTWNGSYSDKDLFYKEINNQQILKFKKSNHLTRDFTQPLLIPMIYSYNFDEFYCKQQFFRDDIKSFYKISTPDIKTNKEWSLDYMPNTIKNECCLIILTNHIKGNLITENEYFEFIGNIIDLKTVDNERDKKKKKEIKNKKCNGSIINSKKNCVYLKIYINEIKMFFKRRYYDEDKGLELYTKRNKSYYFLFQNTNERNAVIQFLIQTIKTGIFLKKKSEPKQQPIIGYSVFTIDINDILSQWDKRTISTFNFIMWLNILGNRSYRDIQQYPIFPWVITDYVTSDTIPKSEEIKVNDIEVIKNKLFENTIREFNLPVGLMELSEKGIKRKKSYIETYLSSIQNLIEEFGVEKNYPNIKELINKNVIEEQKEYENISGMEAKTFKEIEEAIDSRKKINSNLIDINKYKFKCDFCDIFKQLSNSKGERIDVISLPTLFGSHYSNSAYVSHFLTRIFPYTKTAIEIQGDNFDAPDRLFINLEKTFRSVTGEKSDVREPIPEFYFFPEMFKNLNNLEFGKLQNSKNDERKSTVNISRKLLNLENTKEVKVNDVFLPYWCKNDPYLFITLYRGILENPLIEIGPWIDLIFGINSNGINAQNNLNLYLRYAYPDVISEEIKESKTESDKDSLTKMAELGMNPTQILFENCKKSISIKASEFKKNIIKMINNYQTNYNNIRDLNNLTFGYNKQYLKNAKFINNNLSIKIISKVLDRYIIYTGLLNGKIFIFNKNSFEFEDLNKGNIYQQKDNSRITAINSFNAEFDTSFLYFGTEKGSIIIYKKEFLKDSIEYQNIIHPHTKEIISINSNSNLNMLIDSSYDGYINLYTIPSLKLIRSIYNNPNNIIIENVFLSSTPLPCFLTYSNEKELTCYSINGKELYNEQIVDDFIFPEIQKDDNFIDYLIYESNIETHDIVIRQLPYLGKVEI